jgi:hypothetical protein
MVTAVLETNFCMGQHLCPFDRGGCILAVVMQSKLHIRLEIVVLIRDDLLLICRLEREVDRSNRKIAETKLSVQTRAFAGVQASISGQELLAFIRFWVTGKKRASMPKLFHLLLK